MEAYHFDVRKNLLKYDDVMNDQRKIIYEQRRELLESDDVRGILLDMQKDCFENIIYSYAPERSAPEDWDIKALHDEIYSLTGMDIPFDSWKSEAGVDGKDMLERVVKMGKEAWEKKMAVLPPEAQADIERSLLLQTVDQSWKEHLKSLDFMKASIGLRAYAQKNPLFEYKHEAFVLFQGMLDKLRERVTKILGFAELKIQARTQVPPTNHVVQEEKVEAPKEKQNFSGLDIPRNAPCPCGSGKKYKHCCGKLD